MLDELYHETIDMYYYDCQSKSIKIKLINLNKNEKII